MRFIFYILNILLMLLEINTIYAKVTCNIEIFCTGPILHTVQMSNVLNSSKEFVDMKLKYPEATIKRNFESVDKENKKSIKDFVDKNFEIVKSEYLDDIPSDWSDSPPFLETIKSGQLRNLAGKIHKMWRNHSKKINPQVKNSKQSYSLIYLPNPVILPGGMFREFYYWDTYWIVVGLLVSGMFDTVKAMMKNFKELIGTYGYIPYGGRVYLTATSNPPMFVPMIYEIFKYTKDEQFLDEYFPIMERELSYWEENKSKDVPNFGKKYFLYILDEEVPRPQEYAHDYTHAKNFSEEDMKDFYSEMWSATESGWCFSSRWYITKDGPNSGTKLNTKVRSIIPVDLNAFMCGNYRIISKLYEQRGLPVEAKKFRHKFWKMKRAVKEAFWHEDLGIWLDYDMLNDKRRDYFYASNLLPLWARCYEKNETETLVASILRYLNSYKITNYKGGVPASLFESGEEWDLPNTYPHVMHLIIVGMNKTHIPIAKHLAFAMARQWLKYSLRAFNKDQKMHARYNAVRPGRRGTGATYHLKGGYGWTNGALMDIIFKYRNIDFTSVSCKKNISKVFTLMVGVCVFLVNR